MMKINKIKEYLNVTSNDNRKCSHSTAIVKISFTCLFILLTCLLIDIVYVTFEQINDDDDDEVRDA